MFFSISLQNGQTILDEFPILTELELGLQKCAKLYNDDLVLNRSGLGFSLHIKVDGIPISQKIGLSFHNNMLKK